MMNDIVGKCTIHPWILSRHERVSVMNKRKTQGALPKFNPVHLKVMVSKFRISFSRGWFSGEPC